MDSRAKDLAKVNINSLSDITGLRLWSDKEGFSDAKYVELSELFSNEIIPRDSTVDWEAVTPKSFNETLDNRNATTGVSGVVILADSASINNDTVGKVLSSGDQPLIRSHWGRAIAANDIYNQTGRPKFYHKDANSGSFKIPVCFSISKSDSSIESFYVFPSSGKITFAVLNGVFYTGAYGGGRINNIYLEMNTTKEVMLGGNLFKFVFPGDSSPAYLLCGVTGYAACSIDINYII